MLMDVLMQYLMGFGAFCVFRSWGQHNGKRRGHRGPSTARLSGEHAGRCVSDDLKAICFSNAKSLLIIQFNLSFTANNISKESVNSSFQWVTKWVDYSNKYGFGYQLSDHTVGVLFNNGTHMSLLSDKKYVEDPRCLFSLKIIDFMKTNMSFWPSGLCITMQSWDNVQSSPLQKPQSSLPARSPS